MAAKSWRLYGKEDKEMSRIGKMPIVIPAGVEVKLNGQEITVKGSKGTLTQTINPIIAVDIENNTINVTRATDLPLHRALHGLTRSLIANMVYGVENTFKKELEVEGVGYRVQKQGKSLVMNVGFSHQVIVDEIDGITIDVPNPHKIIVSGPDKQAVGQFAADIRAKRPPEPYQGHGIRYAGEVIIRKEGKTGGKKS